MADESGDDRLAADGDDGNESTEPVDPSESTDPSEPADPSESADPDGPDDGDGASASDTGDEPVSAYSYDGTDTEPGTHEYADPRATDDTASGESGDDATADADESDGHAQNESPPDESGPEDVATREFKPKPVTGRDDDGPVSTYSFDGTDFVPSTHEYVETADIDGSPADESPTDESLTGESAVAESEPEATTDSADDGDSDPMTDLAAATDIGETPEQDDLFLEDEPPVDPPVDPTAESDGGYSRDPFVDREYDPTEEAFDGAPDDREMPLADHIEEMIKRLGVVVVVMAVVSGIVFPFGERLINFLWYSYLPGTFERCGEIVASGQTGRNVGAACPRVYHPLALILARLKIASLAGFIVALPVFVYETYLFMRPGLYFQERRYYLASVPTSLVLATVGVAFAHFIVLPAIFTYFVYYSKSATVIAFGLAETFDLMVLMLGGFAFIFQIPLFIMLALMMGLVTRRWMVDRRLLFWGAFAGLSFIFSPDPTGMAPFIVAATMIALFEGTLVLAKWTGQR